MVVDHVQQDGQADSMRRPRIAAIPAVRRRCIARRTDARRRIPNCGRRKTAPPALVRSPSRRDVAIGAVARWPLQKCRRMRTYQRATRRLPVQSVARPASHRLTNDNPRDNTPPTVDERRRAANERRDRATCAVRSPVDKRNVRPPPRRTLPTRNARPRTATSPAQLVRPSDKVPTRPVDAAVPNRKTRGATRGLNGPLRGNVQSVDDSDHQIGPGAFGFYRQETGEPASARPQGECARRSFAFTLRGHSYSADEACSRFEIDLALGQLGEQFVRVPFLFQRIFQKFRHPILSQ